MKRILAVIGHIKLYQLQPTHLTKFYSNLREDGIREDKKYTPKKDFIQISLESGYTLQDVLEKSNVTSRTIQNIKSGKNISSDIAVNMSKSLGLKLELLFNEVCKTGGLSPKITKHEARHFNIEQASYILKLLEDEPLKYNTMITLTLYGGMSQGELTALRWEDIDFENFTINIDKSLQHLPGKKTFVKTTKTETTRIISVPESVIQLLKKYKLWQSKEKLEIGELWHKEESFIFTTFDGDAIFPSTISRWFLTFLRRHNESIVNDDKIKTEDKEKYLLPEVNFHGLRHTNASILISQHTDVATVSKRLGHAKISTTEDIYTHAFQKSDRTASDNLDNLFNKKDIQDQKQG